jgi:capsular polysaccharide export protein
MNYLIYIDCIERISFFKRVANALDGRIVFLTNRLSIYFLMRDYDIKLIKNHQFDQKLNDINLKSTLYVGSGLLALNNAQTISSSVFYEVSKLCEEINFDFCFVWNGATVVSKSICECAKSFGANLRFFELSNLPNKLFWDVVGVNAASSLYSNPEILDNFSIPDEVWQNWKNEYFGSSSSVKQSQNKTLIKYIQIFDYLGFVFGVVKEDFRSPLTVIIKKLKNKKNKTYEICDLNDDFIFVPLQVSSDTQIILNSSVDNYQMLKIVRNENSDTKIFAKIHPAEENLEFIEKIETFCKENKIEIVGNNTKDLIQKCTKLYVINSTVGLEALIYKKDVTILGRALYSNFTQERLKNYICGYLANIEYFSNEPVKKTEIQRILS